MARDERPRHGPREVRTTLEGFKINGRNETSLIRSLQSINNVPVSLLESSSVTSHLIGRRESLIDLLATDNDTVLDLGFNHQQLAEFLDVFGNAVNEGQEVRNRTIEHNRTKFKHSNYSMHVPYSPFDSSKHSHNNHTITNLDNGSQIHFSGLAADMIGGFGFYGGKKSSKRINPRDIAETAGFLPLPTNDPVIQLVKNPDARVTITTKDQLIRICNLAAVGNNVLTGSSYEITPENIDTLFQFYETFNFKLNHNSNKITIPRDRFAVAPIPPESYRMIYEGGRNDYKTLTDIPSTLPYLTLVLADGIKELQLPRSGDYVRDGSEGMHFLSTILTAISEQENGQDHPNKRYFESLLKKIVKDRIGLIQIYSMLFFNAMCSSDDTTARLTKSLDRALPTFKRDVMKELEWPITDNTTWEELFDSVELWNKIRGNNAHYLS